MSPKKSDSSHPGKAGRKQQLRIPRFLTGIFRGGGWIVSHTNCRLEVSNLSHGAVSDHRGSRPRLHPEVTPGNLQLPGGDFLNVVLMRTGILNGFSLITKNQYQRVRDQWFCFTSATHYQLKIKKMKSSLCRECPLGLDIDPQMQSHTDSH